ncbi:MAG: hypothetical protein SGJ10_12640 [Bacteroidota bacterium]|nr:hypothetical protein [Bacteroidota bacterium]
MSLLITSSIEKVSGNELTVCITLILVSISVFFSKVQKTTLFLNYYITAADFTNLRKQH